MLKIVPLFFAAALGVAFTTPAQAAFAIGDLCLLPPCSSQGNPIMPSPPVPGAPSGQPFVFVSPAPRNWFDPPTVYGFRISINAGAFTEVRAPSTFSNLVVVVGGLTVNPDLDANQSFLFGPNVSSFDIVGITPLLDPDAPGFNTAFPLWLDFSGSPTTMQWEALAIPEASTTAMMLLGIAGLAFAVRRRQAA